MGGGGEAEFKKMCYWFLAVFLKKITIIKMNMSKVISGVEATHFTWLCSCWNVFGNKIIGFLFLCVWKGFGQFKEFRNIWEGCIQFRAVIAGVDFTQEADLNTNTNWLAKFLHKDACLAIFPYQLYVLICKYFPLIKFPIRRAYIYFPTPPDL